jgi:hypothetical protein
MGSELTLQVNYDHLVLENKLRVFFLTVVTSQDGKRRKWPHQLTKIENSASKRLLSLSLYVFKDMPFISF